MEIRPAPEMKLTVINPGLVLGEPLDEHFGTSLSLVQRALAGKDPMLPRVGFTVVDLVDIALMHVAAIDDAKTYGERFIGADNFLWYVEMAKILKQAFPDRKIPTRQAPDFVIRFLSLFDSSIKTILPDLGKRKAVDNGRARDVLGISFVTAEDAVRNSARFLVERKLV